MLVASSCSKLDFDKASRVLAGSDCCGSDFFRAGGSGFFNAELNTSMTRMQKNDEVHFSLAVGYAFCNDLDFKVANQKS